MLMFADMGEGGISNADVSIFRRPSKAGASSSLIIQGQGEKKIAF